ncbi:SH3 and cysteine-rich domain-containing protein 2-like isoform X2 [Physella acuta]|nr:SH3 and cysteine-rich domain-containing protein 2-like isoform X2 [Physella acuta]
MLTPKQNGYADAEDGESDEEKMKHTASIKGMWKKAFKSLKSNDKQTWLSKKGSLIKRKDSEVPHDEEPEEVAKEIDPVYSLLKCAADLPKVPKTPKDAQCCSHVAGKGDSSGSTSKASSPSSSASHSPKTRRKKLNARMKSFSLDTPDPPKQLLGIDETTKKKSSSFTNNCFGQTSVAVVASKKRFGFGNRSTSLEIEDVKRRSRSSSPQLSPKSKKKEADVYVSLYHFRGKEKDDMDLRPGCRVVVTNSSDPDWWKGKCNGRSGYFPAKYLLKLTKHQRVYQVTHTMNLTEIDGLGGMRLHKDQIVLGMSEPEEGAIVIHVKAANNREAMCPAQFLSEV